MGTTVHCPRTPHLHYVESIPTTILLCVHRPLVLGPRLVVRWCHDGLPNVFLSRVEKLASLVSLSLPSTSAPHNTNPYSARLP